MPCQGIAREGRSPGDQEAATSAGGLLSPRENAREEHEVKESARENEEVQMLASGWGLSVLASLAIVIV